MQQGEGTAPDEPRGGAPRRGAVVAVAREDVSLLIEGSTGG
ncbi:hypothetical protein [Kineococcus radiotolerans]|nr:hypothetical protein [Kineococcus radiotolerans]